MARRYVDIRHTYSKDVAREWRRLVKDQFHRLEFETTMKYLAKYLPRKGLLLDAGCGPGRYAIELARMGYDIALLDFTPEHVEFAERKISGLKLADRVKMAEVGSIEDMSVFDDDCFDAVLCLGGPLSHVKGREARDRAIDELIRVAKRNAPIFISVFNRIACIESAPAMWPDEVKTDNYRSIVETGDDYRWHNETYAHFFLPEELNDVFKGKAATVKEVVGLEGINYAAKNHINRLAKNRVAWKNWLEMHYEHATDPIFVNVSDHLLAVLKKKG